MYHLYYAPGAISLASHIMLREIGAPLQVTRVAVADNEHRNHKTPEYLKINPRGLIPALAVDGEVLTETVAIALYLAEVDKGTQWLPSQATFERARAYEWLSWLATAPHRAVGGYYRPEHVVGEKQLYEPVQAFAKTQLRSLYKEIEALLPEDGDYLISKRFGIVDPFLLVYFRWGVEIGIEMKHCRRWTRLTNAILDRPSVQEAFAEEGLNLPALKRAAS